MNQIGGNIYAGIAPSGQRQVPGWNAHKDTFARLIAEVRPQTIIEVGTWLGASAIRMAGECAALGLKPRIYCVDTWLGATEFWTTAADTPERDLRLRNGYPQVYFDFLANVVEHGLQDVIVPVPNTSANAARILQHQNIWGDLIYIDGSHEHEDVLADLRAYRRLLRPGGIMFGDDHNWPGLASAVSEELGATETSELFWIWKN